MAVHDCEFNDEHEGRAMNEEGSAALWMCGLCAICMIALYGLAHLGSVVIAKSRMQNAADAASLSAAYEIAHYRSASACSSAASAARKNDATVTSCQVTNNDVIVEVTYDTKKITAQSRAQVD